MAPSRRKGGRAAAAAAAAARHQWKIGDLVLAKMKGFPAWPATVSEPEKWGFSSDRKKLLVYFYGTKQIAFCNYADIEAFTEEKKKTLLVKRQGKGADFVRAVDEIIDIYEKKQKHCELSSGDEPHTGHFEGSRSKSSRKSPEISPDVNNNNQLEAIPAFENHDEIDSDETPGISMEVDLHNTSTINNEPTEEVSILDQLRQTPLSTTTTTRKRQRDGSLQTSVIQRVPSLRRSRSSSGGDPYKFQKPSMTVNGADQFGSDLVSNVLQEMSTLEKKLSGDLTQITLCKDLLLPASAALPLNCAEDILSDRTDMEDDSMLESNCKIEKSGNGCLDKDLVLNEAADLNGKLDLPVKAAILKKKRKPNRKRSTNSLESATLDMEAELQSELHESLTESPLSRKDIVENFIKAGGDGHLPLVKIEKSGNGCLDKELVLNEVASLNGKLDLPVRAAILEKKRKPNGKWSTNSLESATLEKEAELQSDSHESLPESTVFRKEIVENFIRADGDEHLPLVKRARVRMGKQSIEEAQLNEFVEKREKLDMLAPLEELDKDINFSSPVSNGPAKETTGSSSVNDCILTAGRDPMIWKVNKFQLKSITLDVEAALPPSKRLHRALEAMSANAAEATFDNAEAPRDVEIIPNGCIDSPDTNPVNYSVEGIVGSPMRSQSIQSSDNAVHVNASGLLSNLASQNPEVAMLTSSEVEPVDSLAQSLRSPQTKYCKEILVGAKHCDESCTSKMSDMDDQEKVLQPCSFKSVEGLMIATSNEGISDQPSSPLEFQNEKGNENEKESVTLQSSKNCSPHVEGARETDTMKPVEQKPDSVFNCQLGSEVLPLDGTAVTLSVMNIPSTSGNSSGSKSYSSSQSDENIQGGDMLDVANKVKCKGTPCTSDLTPMKDLIAAAQAKLLSRSTSFPDNVVDVKDFRNSMLSPSAINSGNSYVQGSPQNSMIYRRPATDDMSHILQNGSQSPIVDLREKGFNKLTTIVEATVARRSFEALLCTLSRTKDSIGRATRVAIDCAKYGIASEVIGILLQHLERESSLHRRVDLFFLVDSITQFSHSQKGGVGDVYLSLVQSTLPRMLSAAAPHGSTAWENRRQCLKVLRLWLERKTLPESIVQHHIRELESVNETSLPSSYSRRPPRTERALNDPIREMEGMFVDEYGSNTSFQLQHFIHPRLLEDEEGSSDDEKSFEAVTPEHGAGVEDEKATSQMSNEKQCHILEDVDGELEMEDVAPPCGVEAGSNCHVSGVEAVCDANYQHEQHQSVLCAPLPEDLPPSPPPLPVSPPPMGPPCSAPTSLIPQQQLGGSQSNTDITDFHLSCVHNNQNQQPHSVSQQPNNFQGNFIASEYAPYFMHGYGGFPKHIPPSPCPPGSSAPYSSHSAMHSGINFQQKTNPPLPNKVYHLQPPGPPPPTVSNQFSYIQAEPQQRLQSWSSSSFCDQFQYANGPQGGTFYGDRNIRGPIQLDNPERDIFSSAGSTGSILPDKVETLPGSLSHYGPYSESASNQSHGWSIPPRISSYSASGSRLSLEPPISRVNGAQGYWRPR